MEVSMRKLLITICTSLVAVAALAGNAPVKGSIVSESSVDCGEKGHGHKEQTDLVCQEYIVRTTTTEYHIRQPKQKDQALLPLNSSIEFTMDKDKMKFKLNGKKYEFLVVSEAAVTPTDKQ
jgi:hypothetical protein